MIKVFYGDNRPAINQAVRQFLGADYEVFEGEAISISDIINIFKGGSLFTDQRKILIKDLRPARSSSGASSTASTSAGSVSSTSASPTSASLTSAPALSPNNRSSDSADFYTEISKYVDTPHRIAIWETTISQKKSFKDFLKLPGVESQKFDNPKPVNAGRVFEIYDVALTNGSQAIKMLASIEPEQDPYMFFGLLASQAIKKYEWRQGPREKKILKELSRLDIQMKSTTISPWNLIKSFLLRMSSF